MSMNEVRKYVIILSAEERQTLKAVIHKGSHPASLTLKARVLLKADISGDGEGWSDNRIVKALDTSLTPSTGPGSAWSRRGSTPSCAGNPANGRRSPAFSMARRKPG